MYIILSGYMPFPAKTTDELKKKIKIGIFDFHHREFNSVSEEGKDLIKNMLKVDPRKRFTAAKVLSHPWFKKFHPDEDVSGILDPNIFLKL